MTTAIEIYYHAPPDPVREEKLTQILTEFGGRLDFREVPTPADVSQAICLTYEFENSSMAEKAACALREQGEHVEGPADYG